MDSKKTMMKIKTTTIFFSIMLACSAVSDDMKQLEIELRVSKVEFIARNKSSHDPASLEKVFENLLSEDVGVAVAAVDQLKELKDNHLLLIVLRYSTGNIQIRASQALRETADRSAVTELISALVTANEDLLKGGTETVLWNRRLKSALIATISKISGVRYEGTDGYEVPETKEFMDNLKLAGFATKDPSPEAKPGATDSAKSDPLTNRSSKSIPGEKGAGPESSFKWWWILVALAGIAAAAFAMRK